MARVKSAEQPRKTPVQARSIETVEVLFDACIQVLLQLGVEGLTTTRVAERAGVSVGTLYQYFPNKQALLIAVLDRHLSHVAAAVDAACQTAKGATLAVMARSVIDAFIDAKMERPEVSLALYPVCQDASGAAIVMRVMQQSQLAVCDLLATAPAATFADLRMVSFVVSTAPMAPVQATLAAGAAPALVEGVRAQLNAMMIAYLERVASPARAQSSPRSAAAA